MARKSRAGLGRACLLYPGSSDVNLLSDFEGIIHFNAKISDGALDLRVAERELDRAQVARALVDQRCLRPTKRVSAIYSRVEPNAGKPLPK